MTEPALMPEEWNAAIENEFRRVAMMREFAGYPNQTPVGGNTQKLAALCLYQQPFGFSHEDVTLIEDAAGLTGTAHREWCVPGDQCTCLEDMARLRSISKRIKDLLPPKP